MITLKQPLPARIAAYSLNPEIRKEGRLGLIKVFRENAAVRGLAYVQSALIEDRLYIHELEDEDLHDFVAFAQTHLVGFEKGWWMEWKVIDALRDGAFDKAELIMRLAEEKVEFTVENFTTFTPALLQFLEIHWELYNLEPFIQMNWHNGAGTEGFMLLLSIVGAPVLKQYIIGDDHLKLNLHYSALGALCEEGLLDDFFDRETVNLIRARKLIQTFDLDTHDSVIADIAKRYTSDQLLEVFAAQEKFGLSKSQQEARETLLRHLTAG